MKESGKVMKYVFIGLAAVAFVAGFFYKDRKIDPGSNQEDVQLIDFDDYMKPIDPSKIGYEEIFQIEVKLQTLHALAVSPDDNVYVAGDLDVLVFGSDGQAISITSFEKPIVCINITSDNKVYVAFKDQVLVLNEENRIKETWDSISGNANITSVATSENDVFVADAGNRLVWRYNHDGILMNSIGGRDVKNGKLGFILPGPFFDIAISYQGLLWAVNPGRHSLENYTVDGELRSSWERISIDIDGFCGCCNPTHFAILRDGAFVTAEKGIPRVKIHEPFGDLRTVVAPPKSFAEDTEIADIAIDSQERILVLDDKAKAVRIFERKQSN